MRLKTKNLKTKLREKRLIKEIEDNPKATLHDSFIAVGYSEAAANAPGIVTRKPSFIELLDKSGLTDNLLQNKLKEGLDATRLVIYGQEVLEPPDHANRHKYLETALKVKGHLNPSNTVNIQANDYKLIIEDNTDKT